MSLLIPQTHWINWCQFVYVFCTDKKTCRNCFSWKHDWRHRKKIGFFLFFWPKKWKRCDDTALAEFRKTTNTSPSCHEFWKKLIGGLRCSSEQMIKGCLWVCQYKGDITKPRGTYQPRRPHLPCWRSGRWGSLWRSRPGPPPCKTHTFKSFQKRDAQNLFISLGAVEADLWTTVLIKAGQHLHF